MTANVLPLRGLPGRSTDGRQCRHCGAETETQAHVLGSCTRSSLLITARHHRVRSALANDFRRRGIRVFEEVDAFAANGSHKRADIIIVEGTKATVLDPTIRYETNSDQWAEVDLEKKRHYEPCSAFIKEKYRVQEVEVYGFYVGARGTIVPGAVKLAGKLGISDDTLRNIVLSVLKDGHKIVFNHLYRI